MSVMNIAVTFVSGCGPIRRAGPGALAPAYEYVNDASEALAVLRFFLRRLLLAG